MRKEAEVRRHVREITQHYDNSVHDLHIRFGNERRRVDVREQRGRQTPAAEGWPGIRTRQASVVVIVVVVIQTATVFPRPL